VNKSERIGVYGGTFDPVHNTHIAIARAALDFARLDRVLFVVAAQPPHKRHEVYADAEDRWALVCTAVADEPGMEASRIEMDRHGLSFTIDTLRTLQSHIPNAELFLIVGYDSLVELPGWREPGAILDCARLLAVPRPGVPPAIPELLEGRFDLLPFCPNDLSSTEIRRRIAEGESISGMVPPPVEDLIRRKGLYHAPA